MQRSNAGGGNKNWGDLRGIDGTTRARLVANRFEKELGYGKSHVYPIHSERRGGRVMYHMIHATDHAEAPPLMVRAYRKMSGRSNLQPDATQTSFDEIWGKFERDQD